MTSLNRVSYAELQYKLCRIFVDWPNLGVYLAQTFSTQSFSGLGGPSEKTPCKTVQGQESANTA